MSTCSTDGHVKIWDILPSGGPENIASREMKQGELFSLQFCRDIPWVLACGGSQGEIAVWDTVENKNIEARFKQYLVKDSFST